MFVRIYFAIYSILALQCAAVRIGAILVEKQEAHVEKGLNLIARLLNNRQLAEFDWCTVGQISILTVAHADVELLQLQVKRLFTAGLDVLIGPSDAFLSDVLSDLCAESGVYFIRRAPSSHCNSAAPSALHKYNTTILSTNYFNPVLLSSLIHQWNWDSFVVVVSKSSASCHLHKLMRSSGYAPAILEVEDTLKESFMEATNKLRDLCDRTSCWNQVNRVVVALNAEDSLEFLDMSLKLGLINSINWFLFLTLDNLFDYMEPYSHNKMRISLIAPRTMITAGADENFLSEESRRVLSGIFDDWRQLYPVTLKTPTRDFSQLFDGVIAGCNSMRPEPEVKIKKKKTKKLPNKKPKLTNSTMKTRQIGIKNSSVIDIYELGINGQPIKTGWWTTDDAENGTLTINAKDIPWTHEHAIHQLHSMRVLRVTTIAERPYVMKKTLPNGQIVYEGFCVDLLRKLAENLKFDYQLHVVSDGRYGEPQKNSSHWDGMIGEIMRGEADMAVAPITVTALRLEVVDFTDPFLQLGISMLMRKPDKHGSASLTSFLLPLSPRIWFVSLIASVLTSLLLTFVGNISLKETLSEFNIMNSIWYLSCILLKASSGLGCRSLASRLVSSVWWSFTLVLIAQYTANFAAVLTVDRKTMPFNSFEELGNQSGYSFGAIRGGTTMQFFKYSRIETFEKIWLRMQNMDSLSFVKTNDEGVRRALHEKYVFLMESTSLEYQISQNCNLTRVGNVVLGSNGYSIALPKGSKWREQLTRQILDFNEKGVIMMLKNHWWKTADKSEQCTQDTHETAQALGMGHIAGLFLLLACGLLSSLVTACIERFLFRFYFSPETIANVFPDK